MAQLNFPFVTNQPFVSGNYPADTDIKDFGQMIHRVYQGGTAPLFAMLSELGSSSCLNVEHGYWQKFMLLASVKTNAAAISTDTTLTVVDSSQLIVGNVLKVEATGERLLVLTIASATSITVRRAFGTTAAGAIGNGVTLMVVGTAYEEASNRPNAKSFNPAYIKNFTQIFRNAWAVSGTAAKVQMIVGEGNVAESKKDCVHFHSADMESAILFSQLSTGTLNGRPIRSMDGLESMISNIDYYPPQYAAANVFTAGATTNFTQFESFVDPTFNQRMSDNAAATEKVIFTGSQGMKVINQIGKLNGTYQLLDGQTNAGLRFKTFTLTRGTVRLVEHPILNYNSEWSKMAFVLDLSAIKLCYLGGRKTVSSEYGWDATGTNLIKVADNGQDAVGGDLLTEMTIENLNIPAHAVIKNLTAGAAG